MPLNPSLIQKGLDSTQIDFRRGRNLNDFFVAISDVGYVDVNEIWTSAGITTKPGQPIYVATWRVWKYPVVAYSGKLPLMAAGVARWFGFGTGSGMRTPFCGLKVGAIEVGLFFGTRFTGNYTFLDLTTNILPADYATASHHYLMQASKCQVLFWIDSVLRAVCLFGVPSATPEWENNFLYALGSTKVPLAKSAPAFFEIEDADGIIPLNVTANTFVCTDGVPEPPMQYLLYTDSTSTAWSALAVGAAATVNSHPVPIWGYSKKTLMWMATNITATLQTYTGGAWRATGITVTSDGTLQTITIPFDAPIIRVSALGGAGGGTITLAEVYVS